MNAQSVAAVLRLAAQVIVTAAAGAGWALDADLVYNVACSAAALALGVWSWWKNNNISSAAQAAQALLTELKNASADDVEEGD